MLLVEVEVNRPLPSQHPESAERPYIAPVRRATSSSGKRYRVEGDAGQRQRWAEAEPSTAFTQTKYRRKQGKDANPGYRSDKADRQRCRTEVSFFKSMAMLLAMLLPIVAHDVACRTCDDSMQHHAVFAIQCVLSSQHLLIALVHLLLLLRHKK